MVEVAPKDTYATEDVGGGVTVRRRVVAGQKIPAHYVVEGSRSEDTPPRTSEPSPSPEPTSGTEPSPTTGARRRRRGEPTAE